MAKPDRPMLDEPLRRRAKQRQRAISRVSRLTTATAVAGTLATFGFSGLAAVTYSGNAPATAVPTTAADDGSANRSTGASSAQPTPRPTQRTFTTVNPPQTTNGRSHVTSGGSG